MVKAYRKKPVVIKAIQYTGINVDELKEFVGDQLGVLDGIPFIKTLEGNMYFNVGAYIIQGVQGEFYPCKDDIFLATYEEVIDKSDCNSFLTSD